MRLFEDWMACMTRPFEFFEDLDVEGPIFRPLMFFLVFWVVGSAFATLSTQAAAGDWMARYYAMSGMEYPGWGSNLFAFFLSPFIGVFALGVYVCLTHIGVRVFVRGARPIGVTTRGLCFVSAPQVLNLVPWIGWLVAPLWSLFLATAAVQRLHDTTAGRAFAAVIVPPLLLGVVVTVLFTLLIVMLAVAVGGFA